MSLLIWMLVGGAGLVVLGNVARFRSAAGGEVVAATPAPAVEARRSRARRGPVRLSTEQWVFLATSLGYLLVGAYLVLHRGDLVGDADSRVAQAWYVVASRDPHLAAVGFVWNPLPSLAAIPFVLLRGLWPQLVRDAYAGSVVSALCMAGAVIQFRAALRGLGTSRSVVTVLTVCFALNPMIVYYGANGMSEAMYLLFLIGTARYLLEWTVGGQLRPLVYAGVFLALADLTRYETAAAGVAVMVVVFVVGTWARDGNLPRRRRMSAAAADVVVVGLPVVVAFVGWAVVSWVITGQPFEQFTSRYGNASIVRAAGGVGGANGTGWPKIVLASVQAMSYAPLLIALGVVGIFLAIRRGDRRFLALAALAGPLAFSLAAYAGGQTFGFLRYYIPVLPLYLLGAALLLHPLPTMPTRRPRQAPGRVTALAAVMVIGVPGLFTAGAAMANPKLGPAEQSALAWLFHPARSAAERQSEALLPSTRSIAHRVDELGLPDGSIALDTFDCGPLIVMNSAHPHQFVITSDRDFNRVIGAPVAFGVRYLLVPDGDFGIEAIGLAHPGVYQGGRVDDLDTRVVAQYQTAGCPTYRLLYVLSDGS